MRIKDIKDMEYVANIKEYEGKENLLIEDIQNTTVRVPFIVKSVYVKNVKDCTLIFASVMGATFIDLCENSNVYLASH